MKKKEIKLKPKEILFLQTFKNSERRSVREYDRANILLLVHKGKKDAEIADFLEVERTTIWRTKQKYFEGGIAKALEEKERSGQPVKYGTRQEAAVIATACSEAPDGRARWTLELLTKTLQGQEDLSTINRETIRLILKKTNVNLG
jgi:putative transposase